MITHVPENPPIEAPETFYSDAEIGGVMIATPCYGGQVTTSYLVSAVFTAQELAKRGVHFVMGTTESESLVQRARNSLVAKFMAHPQFTHMVFVDADIEWRPSDFIRLIAHDVDMICGLYPKKMEPIEYAVHVVPNPMGLTTQNPRTGAIEIANAATGFLCIKRGVFERMAEAYPQLKYSLAEIMDPEEARWTYNFFDVFIDGGTLLSEDYGFCKRWRDIGGRVWMDPRIKLNHVGKKTYEGDPSRIFMRLPVAKEAA